MQWKHAAIRTSGSKMTIGFKRLSALSRRDSPGLYAKSDILGVHW
jgi:hypothetical protein